MILTAKQVQEIVSGHEWDQGMELADIRQLAESHEELRIFSKRLTSWIEKRAKDLHNDLCVELIRLIPPVDGNEPLN